MSTVLVISEEVPEHATVGVLLSTAPYTLLPLLNPDEAVAAVSRYRPDAAVVAVHTRTDLARLSGLRRTFAQLPLLAWISSTDLLVACLDAGADDCLSQASSPQESSARLAAAIRARNSPAELQVVPMPQGQLILDRAHGTLRLDADLVTLTATEWQIMSALLAVPGAVLPASQLLTLCWASPGGDESKVKYAIARLRATLARYGLDTALVNIRSRGYAFVPPQ